METKTEQKTKIQSVSRAVKILRCLAEDQELGLTELSKMVGLHKSTTAGLVGTLRAEGFLELNEATGKLRLGLALLSLAVNARRSLDDLCSPYLDQLLQMTGETVNLAVLDKNEIVYIAKKESRQSIRISSSVGMRLPVYCTAIGKSILACMDNDAVDKIIDGLTFEPLTPKTITGGDELRRALDDIRNGGVALDKEEYEMGVICMAMPVYIKKNKPVGAVSVSGPAQRMNQETMEHIKSCLQEITAGICTEMSNLAWS